MHGDLFNRNKSKYKKVGVLSIHKLKARSNVWSVGPFVREELKMNENLRSKRWTSYSAYWQFTSTFLYFDLYLNTAYAAYDVNLIFSNVSSVGPWSERNMNQ